MRRIANHSIEVAIVATVLALGAAPPAEAAEKCTTATLKGEYGGLLTGTVVSVGPIALATTVTFDGTGGWSYDESGALNGNLVPTTHFAGTYTVTSKCTGATKDSGGGSTDFVIVGSGKDIQIMMAGTVPGLVFTVVLKKRFNSDD
jgi:hypothetical protein